MAPATPISAAEAVDDSAVRPPIRQRPQAVPALGTNALPRPASGQANLYETVLAELFGADSYLRRQRSLMAWLHRR